jgi:glycosyltransferase involved in cell wall biosynthesis
LLPHAAREFASEDLHWLLHRQIYLQEIDVVQLEYLTMGQYGENFQRLACVLFEHDLHFQSVGRSLARSCGLSKLKVAYEYMRALRYELRLLRHRFDRIQVCSQANADYLTGFLPSLRERVDPLHRSGIDISRYRPTTAVREAMTMLFLGSFRHRPNREALDWLVQQVLPLILEREPGARLVVVGSDPPPAHAFPAVPAAVELRGQVEDVREPLGRYQVFVCPILSGSGVRVKLLEAFASGIPVVSTRLGAEGLASSNRELCILADTPAEFAEGVLKLFRDAGEAAAMAERARAAVEQRHDVMRMTAELVADYRSLIEEKRMRYASTLGQPGVGGV